MKQYRDITKKIIEADAILIGASNGFSITEGLHLFADNPAFHQLLGDYQKKYGLRNILDGLFFSWSTLEEQWGYCSRLIEHYSGAYKGSPVMSDLREIVGEKPYFIVTSNVEGHFELAGFNPEKVYEVEGNWLEMKCGDNCNPATYPTMEMIHRMTAAERDGKIPAELLPVCPVCGAPMKLYDAQPAKKDIVEAWNHFLQDYHGKKLVILELGIGWRNKLIKAPLMELAAREKNATYITINLGEVYVAPDIQEKSYGVDEYLQVALAKIRSLLLEYNYYWQD